METKYKFNFDRLEVTYTWPKEMWNYLTTQDTYICGDDYDVILRREKNLTYHHTFSVYCKDVLVGELYFDSPNPNRPYVYLSVNNEVLYTCVGGISYIEQALSLKYYRISKLDICFDTNRNIVTEFYKLLKDTTQTIIINNKVVKDRKKTINTILHVSKGSLDNIHKYKSFYIKGNEIEAKGYDKREEIEESGKEYIKENLHMDKKIYRLEVRLPNHKQVKKALDMAGVDMEHFYYLQFEEEMKAIFIRNLNRIIRLKNNNCILNYLVKMQ